jgi:hypothetical protein
MPQRKRDTEMKRDDELDLALQQELGAAGAIEPSAGFAASVMQRVREEADAKLEPSPIRFPWRRAAPGICMVALLCLLCVAGALWAGIHALHIAGSGALAIDAAPSYTQWAGYAAGAIRLHLGWLLLIVFIALLPLPLSEGLLERRQHS